MILTFPLLGDEAEPIIAEWNLNFQRFPIKSYQDWPLIPQTNFSELQIIGNRVLFIWNPILLNLNHQLQADEFTLLTLFAIDSNSSMPTDWSSENGVALSPENWFTISPDLNQWSSLHLLNGIQKQGEWSDPSPQNIIPNGQNAAFLFLQGQLALLQPPQPPLPLRAISPFAIHPILGPEGTMAWCEAATLVLLPSETKESEAREIRIPLTQIPQGMLWHGNNLILTFPGKIQIFNAPILENAQPKERSHPSIPRQWYTLHSLQEELLLHIPGQGVFASGKIKNAEITNHGIPSFDDFLASHATKALQYLEQEQGAIIAEKFCAWILPALRNQRSRWPLQDQWAQLESTFTQERQRLRELQRGQN